LKRLAYEDAAHEFERAVASLARTPERDEHLRCDLLLKLASAYTRSGQLDSARKVFSQAADLARRIQEPKRLAMVALDLAPGFFFPSRRRTSTNTSWSDWRKRWRCSGRLTRSCGRAF